MNEKDQLEKKMQEIEKQIEPESSFCPISMEELMSKQFPDVRWVVEQLVPAECIVAISGAPSAYKTWMVLDLAIRVAEGGVLFGQFLTSKTGVLIIDEETGERWIQPRIAKLRDQYNLPVYVLSKGGFKLTEDTVKQLIDFARQNKVGLIVFDSFLRVHRAKDENDAVQMANVFRLLQQLTKKGIAVVFTHHHRKQGILRSSNPSQDMRGSSDILAAVDCHLAIDRKDDVLTITQTKLRQGQEAKPFKLQIINEENSLKLEYAGEIDEVRTKRGHLKDAIKDILGKENKPMYKRELFKTLEAAGVGGGYSTFKSAVQELVDNGELFEKRGEKNKVYCSLKPFDQEDDLTAEALRVFTDG